MELWGCCGLLVVAAAALEVVCSVNTHSQLLCYLFHFAPGGFLVEYSDKNPIWSTIRASSASSDFLSSVTTLISSWHLAAAALSAFLASFSSAMSCCSSAILFFSASMSACTSQPRWQSP